jgi:Fic family protein
MINAKMSVASESRPSTKAFAEKLKPTAETILGVVGNTAMGNNHLDTLLELHRKLTPRHRPGWGQFRDGQAFVCLRRRRIKELAPPGEATALAAGAMAWLNQTKNEAHGTLKPSNVASEIVYLLLHAHPFADGNGRVARAMGAWVLLRDGYELLSDQRLFCHERRKRYFEAVSAREEWPNRSEPWNQFFEEMVEHCFTLPPPLGAKVKTTDVTWSSDDP